MIMTVLTIGTFDLLHAGHVEFLTKAARLGPLDVALNTDDFATKHKRKPIYTLSERSTLIAELECVHAWWSYSGNTRKLFDDALPKGGILIAGDDWSHVEGYLRRLRITPGELAARNILLLFTPRSAGLSTTDLIARIRAERP